MPRPPLLAETDRLVVAPLGAIAALLLGAGCSRTPAPMSADAVPGLIEVELTAKAPLPGKLLDEEAQEDDLYGEAFSLEYSVEIEVDPDTEAEVLAQLRARKDVLWAEPVVRYQALWVPDDPDFSRQWHLQAAGAPRAWDTIRATGIPKATTPIVTSMKPHSRRAASLGRKMVFIPAVA